MRFNQKFRWPNHQSENNRCQQLRLTFLRQEMSDLNWRIRKQTTRSKNLRLDCKRSLPWSHCRDSCSKRQLEWRRKLWKSSKKAQSRRKSVAGLLQMNLTTIWKVKKNRRSMISCLMMPQKARDVLKDLSSTLLLMYLSPQRRMQLCSLRTNRRANLQAQSCWSPIRFLLSHCKRLSTWILQRDWTQKLWDFVPGTLNQTKS